MAQKSLYIRDGDTPIWEAAERVARRNRVSVSHLVIAALTEHLPRAAAEPVPAVQWDEIGTDQPTAA